MKINENNFIIDCSCGALSVLSNALNNISQASIQKTVLAKINTKGGFESKTNNASGGEALVVGRSRKTCVG